MNVLHWLEVSSAINIIYNILQGGLTAALIVLVLSVAKAVLITAKTYKLRVFLEHKIGLSKKDYEILEREFFSS